MAEITIVEKIIKERPELQAPLELHKTILVAQNRLRESHSSGTNVNWKDKAIIKNLQQMALNSNQPIAASLSTDIFDSHALIQTYEKLGDMLIEKGIGEGWIKKLSEEMRGGRINILDAFGAALKEDTGFFQVYGKKFEADPALMLFIISSLIQPCLEEIANNVERQFLDGWWQAQCPVCGRLPFVARLKSRKRYLVCPLCKAEYLADMFLCVNCGNTEPDTLKFLAPSEHPEFRLDFCEKCRHYLKVIDEDRLKTHLPKGLEDIMTLELDFMAKNEGLVRV